MTQKMRRVKTIFTLASTCIALPALVGATQASNDDRLHDSRLLPLVGNWLCSDTGSSKPYPASVRVEGSWIVWRDTGEDSNTIYLRWNPSMDEYFVANLDGEGDVEVSTTAQADPLNATWHVHFPAHTSGPKFTVSYSNHTFSLARPYVNREGKRVVARLRCQKQR